MKIKELVAKLSKELDQETEVYLEIIQRNDTCEIVTRSSKITILHTCGGSLDKYENQFYGLVLRGV